MRTRRDVWKRCRWSLRAILVLVSFACFALGQAAYNTRREANAIAGIKDIRGHIETTDASGEWLGKLFRNERVVKIYFFGPATTDASVDELILHAERLPTLERIELIDTLVSDSAKRRIAQRLPSVEVDVIQTVLDGF